MKQNGGHIIKSIFLQDSLSKAEEVHKDEFFHNYLLFNTKTSLELILKILLTNESNPSVML